MASKTWRIQATAPFAVAGVHHDATDAETGQPAEYEFPEEVAAQVVAAGRARRLADAPADAA